MNIRQFKNCSLRHNDSKFALSPVFNFRYYRELQVKGHFKGIKI